MATTWLHSSPFAPLPPNAVMGGYDSDGSPIYVGRSYHEGDHLPVKVIPSKRSAYISWGGEEHTKEHYELLVGANYTWQPCFGANIPPNAIRTGETSSGEPLFIGRGHHGNSLVVGKIQPSHGCLYVPFAGTEIKLEKYEILVYGGGGGGVDHNQPEGESLEAFEEYKWIHSSAYSTLPPNALVGGNDVDGDMIYVGRAFHNGDMLVAKVIPAKQIGFVSSRGAEIPKDNFEVLCGRNLMWRHCYNHMIPENAVVCGKTSLDQPVYIGRGHYEGSLTVGKISSVHRALFIPFKGVERRLETYEILVVEKFTPGWQIPASTDPLPLGLPAPPPPPPPMTPEKPYPYPPLLAPYPYPEIKPPMPMPTPMEPPPPYAAVGHPMPMPTPIPVYLPQAPSNANSKPSYPAPAPAETYPGSSEYPPPKNYPTPASIYPGSSTYPPPQNYPTPASTYPGSSALPPPQNYPTPAATYPGSSTYLPLHYPPPPPPPLVSLSSRPYDKWVSAQSGYTPAGAVHAGHDSDMSSIYVCRAFHNGAIVPGKAIPSRSTAYISYQGEEIIKTNFEILVGEHYKWVPAIGGFTMAAVEAGRSNTGEPLYVGRTHFSGSLTCGKVHRSHNCLYIPYGGREVRINHNYEILVYRDEYYRCQSMAL